jgi:predicted GNAT superfamily acetyltransferase
MPAIDSRADEAYGRTSAVDAARLSAERAAGAAEVSVSTLRDLESIGVAVDLWQRVWDRSGEPPIAVDLLRALTHGGSYLAGAVREDRLVGAIAGFFTNPEDVRLHSHILGVDRAAQVRGVGFALKLHQRLWALERGIDTITWTFDPLVRANAFFNVTKLGAFGTEYHVDFYGSMHDEINGDGASDRILVTWPLLEARVERACMGLRSQLDAGALRRTGAAVALAIGTGERPEDHSVGADVVLCQVPEDIVGVRRRDPALARAWRLAMREALVTAFERRLAIVGMTRDGWYVIGRAGLIRATVG